MSPESRPPTSKPVADLFARTQNAVKAWMTTGNIPVKVGVVVSLVGLGLLIREANQRGVITVTAEMVLIAVAVFGGALLAAGWRLRGRRPIYGLSLQGGGVATLYLTTYAAFAGYDVLAAPLALVFVVAITVGAGCLAVVQDSRTMAVLGIIGGFLAPVLSYSQPEDQVIVFTFYAILNAAILGVAWFKIWQELNLLGFGFTFGITAFWLLHRHVEDEWVTIQPFVALFVFMYMVMPVLFAVRKALDPNDIKYVSWLAPLVFGTPFVGLGLQGALVGHTEFGVALSASGLAVLSALLAGTAHKLGPQNRELAVSYVGLAVVFIAIAVPFAFDAFYTSTVWALQGVLLVWAGCRRVQWLAVGAGALLQILAGFALAAHLGDSLPYPPDAAWIANRNFLGLALMAATGIASGWLLQKAEGLRMPGLNLVASRCALVWGGGWWLTAGLLELNHHLSATQLSASFAFVVVSFWLAAAAARRSRWPDLSALGVLLVPTIAVALGVSLSIQSHPLDLYGWAVWPVAFAAHFSHLRFQGDEVPSVEQALHVGGYWALMLLISTETHWQVDQAADGIWPVAAAFAASTLIVGGTLRCQRVLRWPLKVHRRVYALNGAGTVLAALSIAVLVALFVSDGDPVPLKYLPVLNPLGLATALLVAVALMWRGVAAAEGGEELKALAGQSWAPTFAAGGTVFVTMELVRTVHHWGDVPFDTRSMFDSTALQASLSIAWTLIALSAMVVGVRRIRRPVWVAGASFMAVVVVKLFLIDFRNQETAGRVVSFIAVGILLLIVGYLAPVPPADSSADHQE